jgi:hypothetical protein
MHAIEQIDLIGKLDLLPWLCPCGVSAMRKAGRLALSRALSNSVIWPLAAASAQFWPVA